MSSIAQAETPTRSAAPNAPAGRVPVWDPVVRILHWGLVASFTLAWITAEDFETLHLIAGYSLLAIVVLRCLWGLIGSKHARFADFVPGMAELSQHIREMRELKPKRYLGHNPAGGVMVVALLVSFLAVCATGVGLDLPGAGDALEEPHEAIAVTLLVLVGLHLAGVAVMSWLDKDNLVRAMITGSKRAGD